MQVTSDEIMRDGVQALLAGLVRGVDQRAQRVRRLGSRRRRFVCFFLRGGRITLTRAALQIPVQYLPWVAGHRPTGDVEAALDQIEQALGELEA